MSTIEIATVGIEVDSNGWITGSMDPDNLRWYLETYGKQGKKTYWNISHIFNIK